MKTGILMALADDRRSGSPLTGVLPYDQVVREFKKRVAESDAPDGLPNLEIWTGKVKSRRIKNKAVLSVSTPIPPDSGESPSDSTPEPEAPDSDTGSGDDSDNSDQDDDDSAAESGPSIAPADPGSMSPANSGGKKGKRQR